MQVTLSQQAEDAIRSLMSDGGTADEVVERALQHEVARKSERVAIQEGIDDLLAGHTHSAADVDREIRDEFGFPPRS